MSVVHWVGVPSSSMLSEPRRFESVPSSTIVHSSDATRSQLRLSTKIELRDNRSNQVVLHRDVMATTSYNILESQFTTRVSEENARRDALGSLAQQIETQIALYFRR